MQINDLMNELVYTTLGWRREDIEHSIDELLYYGVDPSLLPEFIHEYSDITGEYIEDLDIVFLTYELIKDTILGELATVTNLDDMSELIEIEGGGYTHARITPTDRFMFICRNINLTKLLVTHALYEKYN